MNDELNLVRDLAIILISAGIFTIISKALKQPLILGYILAGFLIGPNMPYFFGIESTVTVSQWSEIGMIFMMFALGLEFSFKKLLKAGGAACLAALAVGFWGSLDSIRSLWKSGRTFSPQATPESVRHARAAWADVVRRTMR